MKFREKISAAWLMRSRLGICRCARIDQAPKCEPQLSSYVSKFGILLRLHFWFARIMNRGRLAAMVMRGRWQEPEPPPKFVLKTGNRLLRSRRPLIKVSRAIGGFGLRRITAAILAAARDVSARAGRSTGKHIHHCRPFAYRATYRPAVDAQPRAVRYITQATR